VNSSIYGALVAKNKLKIFSKRLVYVNFISYVSTVRLRDMKEKMLLSDFIKGLGMSNHPNVVQLLPLLKENLDKYGDVTIELGIMKKLMELK
jgi:hypothetical protein